MKLKVNITLLAKQSKGAIPDSEFSSGIFLRNQLESI